nr:hypothetical protein [Tanacetum cinerariifolium]
MESVQDTSGCRDNQKVKYIAGSFVGKALTWWDSQIHTRSQEAVVAMDPETIQRVVQKARTLTDEAIRNGSVKKNPMKKGNGGEPSRDRNVRDEHKRTKTGNAFAITTNPVRREYNGTIPKCVSYNLHYPPEIPCRACFNSGRPRHMAKDCRVAPRMVNPMNARNPTAAPGACYEYGGTDHFKATCPRLNRAQRAGGIRPNQVVANNGGQGGGNNGKQTCGRAFMPGDLSPNHTHKQEKNKASSPLDAPPLLILAFQSLIALHAFDLDRSLPYTSHPLIKCCGIASVDE